MRLPYLINQPWWKRVLIKVFGTVVIRNDHTGAPVVYRYNARIYDATKIPRWACDI